MDVRTPVVVLFRGGNGAIAVARTLGRLGVPVYLVAEKGVSLVERSRYWRQRFWWNFGAPDAETVSFLLDVADRVGGRPVLTTLADWAAIFMEDHAEVLSARFAFPRGAPAVVRTLANKWEMFRLARACGIPTPETTLPHSREDVAAFAASARFPVVVKAADPSRPRLPQKAIVRDAEALLKKFDLDAALGPPNIVLQEYIPGDATSVWMCNAYFDGTSACRAAFTGKKLRQLDATGVASLAICERNDVVEGQTVRLMQAAGYCGAVGIGYRYDARDGQYKLLDVNARLSGIFRLFRASNGMDIARILYRDLTGQQIPRCELDVGRKWMLEEDFFTARALKRSGELTAWEWMRSWRGVRETQWCAIDDPWAGATWMWNATWGRLSARWIRQRAAHQRAIGPEIITP